jgi:hypothetical protein
VQLAALRELRGYRRLYATTNLLLLCVFLLWTYFSLDLTRNAVPALAVAAWAMFTLAYHGLLSDRLFGWRMLLYGNLVDLLFATVPIWFVGRESGSPPAGSNSAPGPELPAVPSSPAPTPGDASPLRRDP